MGGGGVSVISDSPGTCAGLRDVNLGGGGSLKEFGEDVLPITGRAPCPGEGAIP